MLLELFQRLHARPGLDDLVARAVEVDNNKTSDTDLIFKNQYFFHKPEFSLRLTGIPVDMYDMEHLPQLIGR